MLILPKSWWPNLINLPKAKPLIHNHMLIFLLKLKKNCLNLLPQTTLLQPRPIHLVKNRQMPHGSHLMIFHLINGVTDLMRECPCCSIRLQAQREFLIHGFHFLFDSFQSCYSFFHSFFAKILHFSYYQQNWKSCRIFLHPWIRPNQWIFIPSHQPLPVIQTPQFFYPQYPYSHIHPMSSP